MYHTDCNLKKFLLTKEFIGNKKCMCHMEIYFIREMLKKKKEKKEMLNNGSVCILDLFY